VRSAIPRFPSPRRRISALGRGSLAGLLVALATTAAGQAPAPPPPPPPAAVAPADPAPKAEAAPSGAGAKARDAVQRLEKLETSDGVPVAAWYYPAQAAPAATAPAAGAAAAEPAGPPAIVILLHDLEGSHTSVEPLAKALAQRGVAVVAPDLRGHGASTARGPAGGEPLSPRLLKKADLESIVRSGGGQVRDQALVRGEVEVVHGWIKGLAARGGCDPDRLFVVGSGLGATLAAHWVVADASWPTLASGPQGGAVRGLVLVSPAWTTRGFSVSPVLGAEPIARSLPLLVIAGTRDDDAVRLFTQLKRQRPDAWYEKRAGQAAARSPKLQADGPTLYLMELDSPQSGDGLASQRSADPRKAAGDPAGLIAGFIGTVSAPPAAP
jgi:alpha-beta hydrolase superfamily lysophospholipase